jgi:hypothetical protein
MGIRVIGASPIITSEVLGFSVKSANDTTLLVKDNSEISGTNTGDQNLSDLVDNSLAIAYSIALS